MKPLLVFAVLMEEKKKSGEKKMKRERGERREKGRGNLREVGVGPAGVT